MTDEDKRLQPGAHGEDLEAQLAYRRVVARNADRLSEIMDGYGWPTAALVGVEGARRAWLIAQHADRRIDVQRRALALLERALAAGEAGPREVAMLRDRLLVNEGRRQIYGTQIAGVRDGAPVPWPCQDPERMDERRAEVGLESFAANAARYSGAPRPATW